MRKMSKLLYKQQCVVHGSRNPYKSEREAIYVVCFKRNVFYHRDVMLGPAHLRFFKVGKKAFLEEFWINGERVLTEHKRKDD
jgi:hypothetical protein